MRSCCEPFDRIGGRGESGDTQLNYTFCTLRRRGQSGVRLKPQRHHEHDGQWSNNDTAQLHGLTRGEITVIEERNFG